MAADTIDLPGRSRPRVLVDGYDLYLPEGTGIATYAAHLLHQIEAAGFRPEAVFGPASGDAEGVALRHHLFDDPRPPPPPGAVDRVRWTLGPADIAARPVPAGPEDAPGDPCFSRLPAATRLFAADRLFLRSRVIFATSRRVSKLRLDEPPAILHLTRPTPIRLPGAAIVTTIHDLVPLLLPGAIGTGRRYTGALFAAAVRLSDHIVTVTESVRRDVIERLDVDPARVTTIWQAVTVPRLPTDAAERAARLARRFGLTVGGYHLFYGAIEPKKNVERMIDAHAASGVERPLVVVSGRSWGSPGAETRLAGARAGGGGPGLVRLPHLGADELHLLVASARSVLLPSTMEGFGLPIVEGFLHGVPVLTSRGGATEEVAAGAALLVDPTDVASIAAGIARLDADDTIGRDLVGRGSRRGAFFSQERMAARLAPIYERVIAARRGPACDFRFSGQPGHGSSGRS